ncbi:MAG: ABC transporter ATP-binding protein [Paracoccus denitrificans]|uniref:ABC transporter ATP-binding protein n=1 Tax=Paracoccus denitrificans TaxID=266 RepID=A0A533I5R8_PARDE|nr:MAG: ABC transporter ATP-binding protein [Paracoccus denitrificans]
MNLPLIEWSEVSAGYGLTTVIEDIDLTVSAGERVGIIGRNGAGKTTMLSSMMGSARVHKGQVRAGGQVLNALPPCRRGRLGIGIVPQTRDIFRSLTVRENLISGLKCADLSPLEDAFRLFPRLRERQGNLGGNLSGGEQQMLAIARALMGQPDFLLLDEPLEGLSPLVGQEVMAAIRQLVNERRLGCVLVEQHVGTVLDFCDRIVVLTRGRAVFNGPAEELREKSEILDKAIGLRGAA